MPCLFAKICLHKFVQKNLHAGTKRTSFDTPKLGDDLLEIRDSLVFGYSKFLDMRFSDSLPLTPQVCIFFSGFLVGWLVGWFKCYFTRWPMVVKHGLLENSPVLDVSHFSMTI